ncbi:serine hydrolase [Paenibacillus thiaminolyticus]|uniref:Beta-lactamase-related domain-containing protein n=1 Tax=Paenibacillus thiaminolyticus TaxID=49283 RepID=A0A3A3GNB6_PANTH|nr:hypothetical protein DQX05_09350 [Paenibacillus thiaminolyticus]
MESPLALQKHHITSAAFTFVEGDHIMYNQGFGYAALEKKVPVSPDKTMFRVASISNCLPERPSCS